MLRVLPKPEGYDLREKRAEKSGSSRDWLPEDALYDASKRIAEKEASGALLVCWYEKGEDGLPIIKYSAYQSDPRWLIALLADMQFKIQAETFGLRP